MVVETTRDLAAYEKTGKYNGVYHVLHGAISPMLGIGPGDIKLKELMERLQGLAISVILNKNSINFYSSLAPYVSCYITVQEHLNIICRTEWQLSQIMLNSSS